MVWWSILYIVILCGACTAGAVSELKSNNYKLGIALLFSMFIAVYCLFVYFTNSTNIFGNLILGISIVIGISIEIYSSTKDITEERENPDKELSELQNESIYWFAVVANAVLIAPAYLAGAAILFRGTNA